ncbi:MAG TPA: class I SAM-dependent methyltransferase [Acidimicrobiales bacterium]|nr:class I SAM-dependent methyltransferase [Acidimicrobiales bacterium]
MGDRAAWEAEAENWVRWARTPGHDAYWFYRDAFFDHVVPPPGRRTIEVGCGEGRVTRDLRARGHRVVAVDGSTTLLRHARDVDTTGGYLRADAGALPFPDASADLAVAYNSLMDFDDMPAAVSEMARVLEPGAALCICITHPILDAGGFDGDGDDAPYVLRTSYLGTRPFDDTVVKRGLTMHFRGWSHSLEQYVSALSGAGLVIDTLREPVPAIDTEDYGRWARYPMFLHLRARKGPGVTP